MKDKLTSKYIYPKAGREISGFGGQYEEACRAMVIAGIEWFDQNPNAKPEFKQFSNVFGLTTNENEDMDKLRDAMCAAIKIRATGAMVQACTNHVLYVKKNGWPMYLREILK